MKRKNIKLLTVSVLVVSFLLSGNVYSQKNDLKKRLLKGNTFKERSEGKSLLDLELSIGGFIGFNASSLYLNGTGFGFSPHYVVRFDLQIFEFLGVKLDMGYLQQRFPVKDGSINTDFFTSAVYVDYRFHPMKNIELYILAGALFNVRLSSSFHETVINKEYNFNDNYNILSIGVSAGVGFQYTLWGVDFFTEVLGQPIITTATKKIVSNVLILESSSNYNITTNFGAKFNIPLFESSKKENSSKMFLNEKK